MTLISAASAAVPAASIIAKPIAAVVIGFFMARPPDARDAGIIGRAGRARCN
jgi:hypothetical protein